MTTPSVAFSESGGAIRCEGAGEDIELSCCDLFGNVGGDWTEPCLAAQLGSNGNISADPLFCDSPSGTLELYASSPCAPAHAPAGCELIGPLGVACGVPAIGEEGVGSVPGYVEIRPNPMRDTQLLVGRVRGVCRERARVAGEALGEEEVAGGAVDRTGGQPRAEQALYLTAKERRDSREGQTRMTLRPTLAGPCDLLWKLERERYRAFHHEHPLHKADHFYNFCVTAWSMADYLSKHLNLDVSARKAACQRWQAAPEIAAARDVANTAKHFSLTYAPKAAAVKPAVTSVVHVYDREGGPLVPVRDDNFPSLTIEMSDGTRFEMWQFMGTVIDYWKDELGTNGIACPAQGEDDLHGRTVSV